MVVLVTTTKVLTHLAVFSENSLTDKALLKIPSAAVIT